MARKGGSGLVQAIGVLHVLCRTIFHGSTLIVLQQQWNYGHDSVQAVNDH